MPSYVTPGVYYETLDEQHKTVAGIRTDIAAFIGLAERGPLHYPTIIRSWEQFESTFGAFIANGYLAYSVKAFFENGGQVCYVVRVAAKEIATQSNPEVVQPIGRLSSILLSVRDFVPGAVVTIQQEDVLLLEAQIQSVDTAGNRLIWESPLAANLDINRPFQVSSGPAASQGILLDGNDTPTLSIQARSLGTWGNRLSVRVAHSHSFSTRTQDVLQPSDGHTSIVENISDFPRHTLVRIFQPQATSAPLVTHRVVTDVDPLLNHLTWDNPLDTDLPVGQSFDLTTPIFFETLAFSLSVYLDGNLREVFSNLTLIPSVDTICLEHKQGQLCHAQKVVGDRSALIRLTDLNSTSNLAMRLPDLTATNLEQGVLALRGGRDGLAALTPDDFIGDPHSVNRWGLRTLELVDKVAIVAIPDIHLQPVPPVLSDPRLEPDPCVLGDVPNPITISSPQLLQETPPTFTLNDIYRVQQALVAHCEVQQDRFALLDPPLAKNSSIMNPTELQGWRQQFDTSYASLYYPWFYVVDPLQLNRQIVRAIPPSGHVAGVMAKTDLSVGVHKAPANVNFNWLQDLSLDISADLQGVLNPLGINCARTFAGRGLYLYGARTLSSDTRWRFVPVRRLLMMIEESVAESVQWSVFEPNNFALRQMLILTITHFLQSLWQRGAIVGKVVEEAFFVQCDEINNPPEVSAAGQLIIDIGVAPVIPAEFIIFRIGRTQDTLELTEEKRV